MIHINPHNYASFFLLYLDGELPAEDRLAVERFVQSHPDLGEELAMLRQVQLVDEPMVYTDKQALFRSESGEIHAGNTEEYFLLYADNELSTADRSKLETHVLQHPGLQSAFTLLKQTRLEPETLVFADKASLYRRQERKPFIFYLRWQTIGIAASLMGFAFLLWTQFTDKHAPIVSRTTAAGTEKINAPVREQRPSVENTVTASAGKPAQEQPVTLPSAKAANNRNSLQPISIDQPPADQTTVRTAGPLSHQNTTAIRKTQKTEMVGTSFTGPEIANVPVQKINPENHPIAGYDKTLVADKENDAHPEEVLAREVVYREIDIASDEDKKTLLLGSLELNKDKLRGFFRKAGSIFRSKPKVNEETADSPSPITTRSLQ